LKEKVIRSREKLSNSQENVKTLKSVILAYIQMKKKDIFLVNKVVKI